MLKSISQEWQSLGAFFPRVVSAILVLLLSYLAGKFAARLLNSILKRASLRDIHESFFRIITIMLALFLGSILALNILGLEKLAISVLAGGGVTAIVLGFAFREIGENFLAGIFLAFSRPFKTGDAIKTEDIEGKVQDIELRYTHLRTDDGRDIYVPSSQLFNKPVTNFTRDGLRRISFTVGIDYANDAKQACALLEKATQEVEGVLQDPKPGAYLHSLEPQYVEILAFFWVDVFNKKLSIFSIRTNVLDTCRKTLINNRYTVSADTTSNIALKK